MMLGRSAERASIDALLAGARAGRSDALVLTGEPGIGKTTLVKYAIDNAGGMRVLTARGWEAEAEIPFAGLADLLRPVLSGLDDLPGPQAAALRSALALGPPVAGDRFSVCAATMGLLAAAAERQPLLVVVDDLQWLDASSREAVLFTGRRLQAEGIALLVATRDPADASELRSPALTLTGLSVPEVETLVRVNLDVTPEGAAARLHAATAGNPLAVIELCHEWIDPAADPAMPTGSRIERALAGRLDPLPVRTRTALVLAAAAADAGVGTLLAAARASGFGLADFAPAEQAGLVTIDARRVDFRHPLLRSVVYHGASTDERCRAHAVLAAALAEEPGDAAADARAWHLAAATLEPDEEVAAELELAAKRADQRAGYVAAARAFTHAARLSRGPDRPRRLLRAARCWQLAGHNEQVLPLLDEALPLTDDPGRRALVQHMCGHVRMWRGRPDEVLTAFTAAAEEVEQADPARAALMYSDTATPSFMVGRLDELQVAVARGYELGVRVGGRARLVATVAYAGGRALQGERAEAVRLLDEVHEELLRTDPLQRAQEMCHAALTWIWLEGYDRAAALLDRVAGAARATGALGVLPQALGIQSELHYRQGRWHDARAAAAETLRLAEETRSAHLYARFFAGRLDAVQGRAADCLRHADRTDEVADRLGIGCMPVYTGHQRALLAMSTGDTAEVIRCLEAVRALPVASHIHDPHIVPWVFDLVEAYVRAGRPGDAHNLLSSPFASGSGAWVAAAAGRCHALLADPGDMAGLFETALATALPFEKARTHLAYGERLRRAKQRAQAREHLRAALDVFDRLGAQPWADRTRTELRATGTTVAATEPALPGLTPQELQVALVVARGATNHEAAATLFLSQKTIEYHLSNIYRKANIKSRTELAVLTAAAA